MIELLLWMAISASPVQVSRPILKPQLEPLRYQPCGRLNSAEFVRRASAYRAMLNDRAMLSMEHYIATGRAGADLFFYGRSRCPEERFNAPRSVVLSMARPAAPPLGAA